MNENDKRYNELSRQLDGTKKDLAINYKVLDELTKEQRKDIEAKLVRLCQAGYAEALLAIPYIRTIDISEKLSLESFKPENTRARSLFLKGMYLRTGDEKYLQALSSLSMTEPMSFSDLIDVQNNSDLPSEQKELVSKMIDTIINQNYNNPNYKYLYEYKASNKPMQK